MKHKVYKVDAVECDEYFYFYFKTLETDLKEVKNLAIKCADGWGADVIEFKDITSQLTDKEISCTYEQL